jgi:hypothetical protein
VPSDGSSENGIHLQEPLVSRLFVRSYFTFVIVSQPGKAALDSRHDYFRMLDYTGHPRIIEIR